MEREAFLARLRTRLAEPSPANLPHPLVPIAEVPPVRYSQDLRDPVAAFTQNATLQGAVVRRVEDLPDFLASVTSELQASRVVVSQDPEVAGVPAVLRSRGVEVLAYDRPHPDAHLGVVGAAFGIAATGTVVFDAGRAGGRSASLLPPAIVVLVGAENVLIDAGEIFRRMPERFPDGLPSQLVFCTGPSKSGDIELELTTGVHGPGRVWIGLIGS
jgi:L-lactate dehydrogenase complex protein LldG